MFAVYADAPHPDAPLDGLRLGERPEPEAPEGWVTVEITAASLNMHDIWTLRGVGIKGERLPVVLGCDAAGVDPDGNDVIATYGTKTMGFNVQGVDPDAQLNATTIGTNVIAGDFKRLKSTADGVVIGNVLPRYEYGMRVALDYKSFDIAISGQGVGKRSIWGAGQLAIPGFHVKDGAMPQAIAADYWREDHTDAFYPRAWNLGGSDQGFVMVPQTRYLLNMAYFRIKNITLGYNLPASLLRRVGIGSARIYANGTNLLTFSKYKIADPEVNNYGTRGWETPYGKTYTFGIELGF